MARRKKIAFSNAHSKIDDIEVYYIDSEDALNTYYNIGRFGREIPVKFVGCSQEEVDQELKERKETLDRMCSLEILASVEAKLRIDYIVRGQNKLRDDFSKKLREIFDKKENRASLVEDIISIWRSEYPEHKSRLDDLQKAIDYRNWLAHGRYWFPKRKPHIDRYDYLSIYTLASDILTNMELLESA
jgi:hypothetical protein